MERYKRQILDALLDSYENSGLFRGDARIDRRIQFTVTPKTLPAYFDESSAEYEVIHEAALQLESRGFVKAVWKKGGILHKLILAQGDTVLDEIYSYVKRTPLRRLTDDALECLAKYRTTMNTPVCSRLLDHLQERLEKDRPVKEYLDLHDMASFDRLMAALHAIETNVETGESACYVREFSIELFHDSKAFEQVKGKALKALREFGEGHEGREEKELLAEYGIYHTPNYVYLKGDAKVRISGASLALAGLKQGIGVSGDDLERVEMENTLNIKCVLTIENQTTFFRWQEPETLVVYLGGYHNSVRRRLLQKIYGAFPQAAYRHFGDMDAGGFEIYRNLKEKTGIPFEPYRMDRKTMEQYRSFAKPLTDSDRKRLEKMDMPEFSELIRYMLQENIKLEQECIAPEQER